MYSDIWSKITELVNHYLYGEQSRARQRFHAGLYSAVSTTIPTDPNVVWGCDFSGMWDGIVDCQKLKARGARFVCFKAADGTLKAKFFDENVAAAKAAGLVVGAYFWLYRTARISGTTQANAWWNIVKDKDLDFYSIDFEWTSWMGKPDNPTTSDLLAAAVPFENLAGEKAWVYSAPGYMNQYFNHDLYWKSNPFWQAQYGVLVPDAVAPWGFNGHTCWQITDRWPGSELGVDPNWSTAEDGNIWNGSVENFNAYFELGDVPVPPPQTDTVTFPYDGVKMSHGRRYGSDVQVVEVDKGAIAKAIVTKPDGCKFIDSIAGDIVANGGDYDMTTCIPIGLLKSEGRQYAPQAAYEPALGFNADNSAEIDHTKTSWPNAVGLKRYILINGQQNPNTSAAWYVQEPRTLYGVKADGSLVIVSVRGRDVSNTGLDLFESAAVMKEFGCVTAGDGDGGGSVQARVSGTLFLGTSEWRHVADFVSITMIKGDVPMAGRYKCTVKWPNGTAIRPEPNAYNTSVGKYEVGNVFYASELVPDSRDLANPDKLWAKVESDPIYGSQFLGRYVAVKYPNDAGIPSDRCDVVDTTPPSGGDGSFATFLRVEEKDAAGNVIAVYEGTAELVKK